MVLLDTIPFTGPEEEKLVLTIDVGHSYSSVAIVHLQWGQIPIVRSIARYPGGHASSRTPSAIAYDMKERPRSFGVETLSPEVVARGKAEGWTTVTSFKSQLAPLAFDGTPGDSSKSSAKLLKKARPQPTASIPRSPSSLSINSLLGTPELSPLARSITPERPVAADAERRDSALWVSAVPEGTAQNGGKKHSAYNGPTLKLVYADWLKNLISCAREWFAETTTDGEAIFLRLWSTTTFVLAHPADWAGPQTDVLREAMVLAHLLPAKFAPGRLVFVKEPAATVYFARRHTRESALKWLQLGRSFALCDAAEHGTSIIGYTAVAVLPRLKLRAYEPSSRLNVGAGSVSKAFQAFLTKKLSKAKAASLMDQFETKVKTKFASAAEGFTFRTTEGSEIAISGDEIEAAFKPSVDAIIVRLSSTIGRGDAKSVVLAGGFGESPYLQRRLREAFEPSGIAVIVPDIPTHNAVSEGAARFYLAETVLARPTRFDLGVSSSVDWSSNWQKGMEREIFTSVSGKRFILGKWAAVVPKGTVFDAKTPVAKSYNVKHVLASSDPMFKVELWAHDPASEPVADGWMTDLKGARYPNFEKCCTVEADLSSLVAICPVHGEEEKQWVQLDFMLLTYLGKTSLESCVAWDEKGIERRGPPSMIPNRFF